MVKSNEFPDKNVIDEFGEDSFVDQVQEVVAHHKSGKEFPCELSLSAMKFNSQWWMIGILRDITERKQLQEKLLLAKERAEAG